MLSMINRTVAHIVITESRIPKKQVVFQITSQGHRLNKFPPRGNNNNTLSDRTLTAM